MTAILVRALWWLGAASPSAELPPPVELVPFDCAAVTDPEVRPALAVELRGRLLDEAGPVPSGVVAVSASCRGSDLILAAASPGRVGPPLRLLSLAGVAENARPRAVALAMAELVRPAAAWSSPVAEGSARRPEYIDRVHGEVLIGPAVGGFGSNPSTVVAGAHVRYAHLWAKARAESLSRWWFGPIFDLNVSAASFWNGDGDLSITSEGLGYLAERPGARWTPEFAIGDRFGFARFTSEVGPNLSAKSFVGSTFVEMALKVLVGPVRLRLAAEIDVPIVPPGDFCSNDCVDFSGPWLITTLDAVMTF